MHPVTENNCPSKREAICRDNDDLFCAEQRAERTHASGRLQGHTHSSLDPLSVQLLQFFWRQTVPYSRYPAGPFRLAKFVQAYM